jgi:hypothetical protein
MPTRSHANTAQVEASKAPSSHDRVANDRDVEREPESAKSLDKQTTTKPTLAAVEIAGGVGYVIARVLHRR